MGQINPRKCSYVVNFNFEGATIHKFIYKGNMNVNGEDINNKKGNVRDDIADDSCNEPPHKEQNTSFQLWDEVKQAVKSTIRQGLWWSSRSWSVVYRICQIKGYMNGFSQFARDVNSWGIDWEFNCNYDAIQKPTCKGFLSGNPDTWVAKGAPQQFEKLGSALLLELDNLIK